MPTIGVVGLGLMGASFALALKKARPELTIVGFDRDAATALKAMDRGIASAAGTDLDAIDMADVIVVAVPILAMQEVFKGLRTHVAGKVVTDVASTKGSVMEWAAGAGIDLVGGHPMCGRETSGIDAADADLFAGAPWILTRRDETVIGLVEAAGAHPLVMDAATHDRLVAGVSHAALLLSVGYVLALSGRADWAEASKVAASGFRDMSRLAAGDPAMSAGITRTNRDNLLEQLDAISHLLARPPPPPSGGRRPAPRRALRGSEVGPRALVRGCCQFTPHSPTLSPEGRGGCQFTPHSPTLSPEGRGRIPMIATVRRARRLDGDITLPGDKSISHRALILGSIADGDSRVRGISTGADVRSTAGCMRALGVEIDDSVVHGVGLHGLRASADALDCGNSGTTMRLLAGLLSAQKFASELRGDESLTTRPMDRVVTRLRELGAAASRPPLEVGGDASLRGIEYRPSVPSAQVKSAVLLAGLYAVSPTAVLEPVGTRNHNELMLAAMGAGVKVAGRLVTISPAERRTPLDIEIPGDLSGAAFWLVVSGLVHGSRVRIRNVGINPTRTAVIDLMRACGLAISITSQRSVGGELLGDLEVGPAPALRPLSVSGDMAAEMIDELPVLAVLASQLPGTSRITGAAELRVKESDRIAAIATGLAAMGADITALEDGWGINGPRPLEGARVHSDGDHRSE